MKTYKYYTALIIAMAMSTCMVFAQAPVRRNTTTNRATSTPTRKPTQRQTKPATTYAATGMENGHGYVDLGLSVKWATCNVGASTPGGWGEYYAWGETETKSHYSWSTYFDAIDASGREFRIYNRNEGLKQISSTSSHDAARMKWGGTWRMPTQRELEELLSKCSWSLTKFEGHDGYKITGPSGNSIFLPLSGRYETGGLHFQGQMGTYWGSSLEYSNENNYYCSNDAGAAIHFYWRMKYVGACERYSGCPIRPVRD